MVRMMSSDDTEPEVVEVGSVLMGTVSVRWGRVV